MRFTKVGGRREEAHIVIIRREKKVTSQEWLQSKKKEKSGGEISQTQTNKYDLSKLAKVDDLHIPFISP